MVMAIMNKAKGYNFEGNSFSEVTPIANTNEIATIKNNKIMLFSKEFT